MQLGRALAWIGGVTVIAVGGILYFGLSGTERQEAPPAVLAARGSEAADSSSAAAGPRARESRRAAASKSRRAARRSRNRGARAPAEEAAIPSEEGSSRAAAERLRAGDRTAAGAPAPQPGTSSSRARAGEGASDRPESGAEPPTLESFIRAASEAADRDAADREAADREAADRDAAARDDDSDEPPRDDRAESETPAGSDDEDEGGPGGGSDPRLEGVSVGSPVMMTCAAEPWICSGFPLALRLPGVIQVVADGTEAVQLPVKGGPDIVWIRTTDGVVQVFAENLTDAGQLAALVGQVVPSR